MIVLSVILFLTVKFQYNLLGAMYFTSDIHLRVSFLALFLYKCQHITVTFQPIV